MFTDHPIVELDDAPDRQAPTRSARLLRFDGNKYATVRVGDIVTTFKAGYLHPDRSRCGQRRVRHMTWRFMMRFHTARVGG